MTVRYINAGVLEGLRELPSGSIDCIVTSPPYWGLRDYGTGVWQGGDAECDHRSPSMRPDRSEERKFLSGSVATNSAQLLLNHRSQCGKCGAIRLDSQIGLEPSFRQHIEVLTEDIREARRVLKPCGTFWLNYGDSYATSPNGNTHLTHDGRYRSKRDDRTHTDKPFSTVSDGLKAKDLSLVSSRLAIALCDDGWWLRAENIWVKPNPKPRASRTGHRRPMSGCFCSRRARAISTMQRPFGSRIQRRGGIAGTSTVSRLCAARRACGRAATCNPLMGQRFAISMRKGEVCAMCG